MSYKSATSRATTALEQNDIYRSQTKTLQELFPSWTAEDLQSLLADVGGDLEIAVARISEGHAEQWGSVTRKKDKKSHNHPQSQPKDSSRGGRGGKGGARGGGPGRGGASVRPRGPNSARTNAPVNGHITSPSTGVPQGAWSESSITNRGTEGSAVGWGNTNQDAPSGATVPTSSSHGWSDSAAAETNNSGWATNDGTGVWTGDADVAVNGSVLKPNPTLSTLGTTKSSKIPPGSKLSWAQIARPPEVPVSSPAPVPLPPMEPSQSTAQPLSKPLPEAESSQTGWEEPTTIQPPTWDDEPHPPTAISVSSSAAAAAVWPSSISGPPSLPTTEEHSIPPLHEPDAEPPKTPPEISAESLPPPSKPIAPRSKSGLGTRYKTADQPVVMPSSSFGSSLEKVGMQFGSLSLGGEALLGTNEISGHDSNSNRAHEPAVSDSMSQPVGPPVLVNEPPSSSSTALSSGPSGNSALFQTIPQQLPASHQPTTNAGLSSSISAPSVSPQSHPSSAFQSLSGHLPQNAQSQASQQHSYALSTHLDATQSQSQPQNQVQHSPQQQPSQPQQPQQQNQSGPYLRQSEQQVQGYFNAPTPPIQGGGQDYSGFGGLGQGVNSAVSHQGHVQGGPSHLGGFGANEYGYTDAQRGFYEAYGQQGGFGNRNAISHDDSKAIPATQQQSLSSVTLPPQTSSQSSQGHPPSTGSGAQPQPSGSQGPQQYPHPLPYFYPYPQNQFYGTPYNQGYGVPQPPFVKYPPMFQPGPPSAAPSPTAKQGPGSGQPQSNPYGQNLYSQQHPSASYDDLSYQHHSQHQHNHSQSVGTSLPTNEYGKQHQAPQLYTASQGMQSFIGLGHGGGPSAAPQRGSPEAAYKPYAAQGKDITGGVGVGQPGVGTTVVPGRTSVQQPQQGGFYNTNRFSGGGGTGGPQGGQSQQHQHHQSQGQGPQGHVGYPQGEGSFYSYQPRGQQGYWQ